MHFFQLIIHLIFDSSNFFIVKFLRIYAKFFMGRCGAKLNKAFAPLEGVADKTGTSRILDGE